MPTKNRTAHPTDVSPCTATTPELKATVVRHTQPQPARRARPDAARRSFPGEAILGAAEPDSLSDEAIPPRQAATPTEGFPSNRCPGMVARRQASRSSVHFARSNHRPTESPFARAHWGYSTVAAEFAQAILRRRGPRAPASIQQSRPVRPRCLNRMTEILDGPAQPKRKDETCSHGQRGCRPGGQPACGPTRRARYLPRDLRWRGGGQSPDDCRHFLVP